MSSIGIAVPFSRYYDPHLDKRGMYVFADDFFNTTSDNWFKDLKGKAAEKMRRYLANRPFRTAELAAAHEDLRDLKHTTWNEPDFQTMAGQFINHYVYRTIGSLIVSQYEHYDPSAGAISTKGTTVGQTDQLVRQTVEITIDLEELQDTLKNNIVSVASSSKWLDRQQAAEEKKEISPQGGQIVVMNPDLAKFRLTPEIVGTDAVNVSGGSLGGSRYAQELVINSLVGWHYTGLSERTVGAPADLHVIIMDILIRQLEPEAFGITELPTGKFQPIGSQLIGGMHARYEALLASELPRKLEAFGADLGGRPGVPALHNPFALGIVASEERIPSHYLFWNMYRAVRTPFYNRNMVTSSSESTLDIYNKFSAIDFLYSSDDFQMMVQSRRPTMTTEDVKGLWRSLVGDENVEGNLEKVLLTGSSGLSALATLAPTTEEGKSVDKQLVTRLVVEQLRKLDLSAQTAILTHAITGIFYMFFQLGLEDWSALGNRLTPPLPLGGHLSGTSSFFRHQDGRSIVKSIVTLNMAPITDFGELDHLLAIQAQQNLRSVLGNRPHMPMGGLSYQWDESIQVTRMNEQVVYPGDATVLGNVGTYGNLWVSDIENISKEVQFGMRRLSHMYWWRDIIRWMELVYTILRPQPMIPGPEKDKRYKDLENVLKVLFEKQITIMRDYVSRLRALGRRPQVTAKATKEVAIRTHEDPAHVRDRRIAALYATRTLCYLKRQIAIIFRILELAQQTPVWVHTGGASAPYPNMARRNTRLMSTLRGWFRGRVEEFAARAPDPAMTRMVRKMLTTDFCDRLPGEKIGPTGYSVSTQYITDEVTAQVANPKFWKLLARTLKEKDNLSLDSPDKMFYGIYVVVYTTATFGDKRNYYLLDLMPFVLKGQLGSTLKPSPQWLSGKELAKTTAYPPGNMGLIIVADKVAQIGSYNKWKALDTKWFSSVLAKANKRASETGNKARAASIIRMAVYLLLRDSQIWDRVAKIEVGSNSGNQIALPAGGKTDALKHSLIRLYEMPDSQKRTDKRMLEVITRDMVERNLDVAKSELRTEG
jgi:hypothetical protein